MSKVPKIEPTKNSGDLPEWLRQHLTTVRFITQEAIQSLTGWDRKTCRKLKYLVNAGKETRTEGSGIQTLWQYKGVNHHGR